MSGTSRDRTGTTHPLETGSMSAHNASRARVPDGASGLTAADRQRLDTWNATRQTYPVERLVPQLVAAQAALRPNAPALLAGDQSLTYFDLDRRANRLAHALRRQGVGPNVLVAVCLERSLDMVVAFLGVMRAGGAYVPLDAHDPPERLGFMLRDSQALELITEDSTARNLPDHDAQVLCLDTGADLLARQPDTECASTTALDDLAYVIYTSGSTGQPKGVQVTHRSLLNLVYWHQRAFAITPADRATQLASPGFDAAVWELWPYLTAGACVYLPDDDQRRAPEALRDWLVAKEITVSFVPTPLAEDLLRLAWPHDVALRFLLTGADTLHSYPPADLPFALINNYGPTECTVVATSGRVAPRPHATSGPPSSAPSSAPSIGHPIANTRIYILDEHLQQVPIGTPGELCIGGAGVARGYLNRPELTHERFVHDPFGDEPGARLYRTGDLARYLPDGDISFLGRDDDQVKIRGYRVETEEVVAALTSHPAVRASVVAAQDDAAGQQHLVAYVVFAPGAAPTARALRDDLAMRLPVYMIPAIFVALDALPVLPSGKVDRHALPAPATSNRLPEDVDAAPEPRSQIEEHVAETVCALLRLERVGLDDNFFMLGGHSMLATQLIVRLAETYGVEIPIRTLFDHPTVRELAGEVEQQILAHLDTLSDEETQQLLANDA